MNNPLWSVVLGRNQKLDTDKQNLIARYLLGDLSEAESAQLEDSAFSNPDQLEELRSVENELIDEYVRGELPAKEAAKFESQFLANPERRQRVEFARALAKVSSNHISSHAVSREGTGTIRNFFASFLGLSRPAMVYSAVALTVIVLLGSWWLFTKTNSHGNQVAQRQTPGAEQVMPSNGLPGPSQQTPVRSQPPENTRGVTSQPSTDEHLPGNNRNGDRPISHPETSVATFLLLPGVSRGSDERTKLVIPHGRQLIRLKLKLEGHDVARYRSFAAELSRANSSKAWASQRLPVQRNGTLVLHLPASSLPAETADYDLTLRGRASRNDAFETLGYYYLTIIRE
jgi:hypothetical protein